MFDFARNFLGPVYIGVMVAGFVAVGIAAGPIVQKNRLLGIIVLLAGFILSLLIAGKVKRQIYKPDEERTQD